MKRPVVLTLEAKLEFEEATDWYELNASMGERFVEHVHEALERIAISPEIHVEIYRRIRRHRVRQFRMVYFTEFRMIELRSLPCSTTREIRKAGKTDHEQNELKEHRP